MKARHQDHQTALIQSMPKGELGVGWGGGGEGGGEGGVGRKPGTLSGRKECTDTQERARGLPYAQIA